MNTKALYKTASLSLNGEKINLQNIEIDVMPVIREERFTTPPYHTQHRCVGATITIITSNMPESLREAMIDMVKTYTEQKELI